MNYNELIIISENQKLIFRKLNISRIFVAKSKLIRGHFYSDTLFDKLFFFNLVS